MISYTLAREFTLLLVSKERKKRAHSRLPFSIYSNSEINNGTIFTVTLTRIGV